MLLFFHLDFHDEVSDLPGFALKVENRFSVILGFAGMLDIYEFEFGDVLMEYMFQ
jgi:hypothetical protein